MATETEIDVEKSYPKTEFVAKLRRLADAIENDEKFEIQIAGERIYVPVRANFPLNMKNPTRTKKSNSRSNGLNKKIKKPRLLTSAKDNTRYKTKGVPTGPQKTQGSCLPNHLNQNDKTTDFIAAILSITLNFSIV